MKRLMPTVVLLAVAGAFAWSQEPDETGPDGFREIRLGMSLQVVKDRLLEDPYFDYRGDPDVSFLPLSEQTLIECEGNVFVSRAYFQFQEGALATITLLLDRSVLDHYTLFTTLTEQYGPHDELSPDRILWRFPEVDLSLERPLTVKYVDREAFERVLEEGQAEVQVRELARERFLEEF